MVYLLQSIVYVYILCSLYYLRPNWRTDVFINDFFTVTINNTTYVYTAMKFKLTKTDILVNKMYRNHSLTCCHNVCH